MANNLVGSIVVLTSTGRRYRVTEVTTYGTIALAHLASGRHFGFAALADVRRDTMPE